MKKGKTFDYYLQEALKELEKTCEEFNPARCERLLTRCCRVLLEGSDNLGKLVKEHNDKDVEGNSIKRSQDSLGEGNFSLGSSIVLEAEDVEELHGKTLKYSQCRRDHSGVLLSLPVLSSLGSHNCSPCSLPEAGRGLHGKTDKLNKAGNSRVQGCCGTERRRVRDEKNTVLLSARRFHSNPPEKSLIQKCGRDCDGAKKHLVVINNQTGESVEVSPTEDPTRALAEALSKLTPGVKTTVWNGESEDPQQQCQGKNNDGNPDGVNHESNCSEKFCESPFNL